MWTPLAFEPRSHADRGRHYLRVLALLKPGSSVAEAQADLGQISRQAEKEFPETNSGRTAYVQSLTDDAVRGAATAMPSMIGSVILVLMIACANVANLLLARCAGRQKEVAVRLALGASRWRLVRQLLTESVLLALLGGAAGLIAAVWAIEALSNGIPRSFAVFIPGWSNFGLNGTILAFTLMTSMLTGVLFGLAPAWQSSRANLAETLKEGAKGGGGQRLRSALVVGEIALSLVLLTGAGLLIRSFVVMMNDDLGIRPENVLALEVSLPEDRYRNDVQRVEFYEQLLSRVENVPGVSSAGAIDIVPISGAGDNSATLQIDGRPPYEKGQEPYVQYRVATPGYFDAIGTGLRQGRVFGKQDDSRVARVVLANETLARRFFPGETAIGRRLRIGRGPELHEIIGIVADVKNDDLEERADPAVYVPFAQASRRAMNLVVHSNLEPALLAAAVRSEARALDRNLPVSRVRTLTAMIDERASPKRLMTWTIAVFALVALILAAVGVYAVMSYTVEQRTREIGIRLALGAQQRSVVYLVLGRGLKLTLLGVLIGLAAAFAVTRAMSFFLYRVTATDPPTFIAVALLLILVAMFACFIPARRATRIDPMTALRYE
jgi:putative ABC transport system permease protein